MCSASDTGVEVSFPHSHQGPVKTDAQGPDLTSGVSVPQPDAAEQLSIVN